MFRQAPSAFLAVFLAILAPALTPAADAGNKPADKGEGADFIGKWQKDEDGIQDVITIARNGDDWSISGVYYKDGQEVGGFTGKNVKFRSPGELTYVSHIDKAPPGHAGLNDARITLKIKNGDIIESWRVGRLRGSHQWKQAK